MRLQYNMQLYSIITNRGKHEFGGKWDDNAF
jgi:hypothetical protein